ncbi:MAG: hypothetical protein V7K48_14320 [Nostoc sp.]|uniref:hypothetical protein n=1 Tax=Nostoc sp. TaxID=1180 RepID=UPI002FF8DB1F
MQNSKSRPVQYPSFDKDQGNGMAKPDTLYQTRKGRGLVGAAQGREKAALSAKVPAPTSLLAEHLWLCSKFKI